MLLFSVSKLEMKILIILPYILREFLYLWIHSSRLKVLLIIQSFNFDMRSLVPCAPALLRVPERRELGATTMRLLSAVPSANRFIISKLKWTTLLLKKTLVQIGNVVDLQTKLAWKKLKEKQKIKKEKSIEKRSSLKIQCTIQKN